MNRLTLFQWLAFLALNAVVIYVFCLALFAPPSDAKKALLPGTTTHGHYQIEMDCSACHTPGLGIDQESCLQCHEQELKEARDTHPASKFNDPTNATRLEILDAQKCTTCHREHVEDQTSAMGLTLPEDYCYHCHQETLQTRPSHANLSFDSCSTSGCHNYHDNRALYENFLVKHYEQPDHLQTQLTPRRSSKRRTSQQLAEADFPRDMEVDPVYLEKIVEDWSNTAHASIQCTACHSPPTSSATENHWVTKLETGKCSECHLPEHEGFLAGRHGMRFSRNLEAMKVAEARIEMHSDASHRSLNCVSCHEDHRFDTKFAAVEACLQCHADNHSLSYKRSPHYALFNSETEGDGETGSGVSCATCHLPRIVGHGEEVTVQHNQNNNLRPNEKMARDVCMNCHGLQYSLNSLIDKDQIANCFTTPPRLHTNSLDMAKAWFDAKEKAKQERLRKRAEN